MNIFGATGQSSRSSVVTVGMFDGVHPAHQKILKTVARDARRLKAKPVVVTFAEHPQMVIGRGAPPGLITTLAQKLRFFKKLGISRTLVVRFNAKFARTTPETFVRQFLIKKLGMQELCVGYDFAFGKDRTGNLKLLRALSKRYGFRLKIFPRMQRAGVILSSTSVREALHAGELGRARKLLGRFYTMQGVVERGLGLGKKLGFPTANLCMENNPLLPDGVYAVFAKGPGFFKPGVLNVGMRPTLRRRGEKPKKKTWELHLWNFSNPLYGKSLEVYFVRRLRPERKFQNLGQLGMQISKDIVLAKRHLSAVKTSAIDA